MNKAQLIEHLASETGLTKADTERVLNSTLRHIKDSVKGSDDVTLVGFGTFTQLNRKPRMARNPRTGEPMQVPGSTVPKFRAGKAFLEDLSI